jgi:hypothetical protein
MLNVNASATPNVQARSGAGTGPANAQAAAGENVAAANPAPAAILDISAKGRDLAALQLRILDEPLISEEDAAKMKADFAKSMSEPDMSRQIHTVAGEGTVNRLVQDVVNYKTDPATARLISDELGRLINGTYENGNVRETLEERVVNREKGLELAKYIAETYIDDPKDKNAFLNGVKHFYDNAVLVDKGYIVTEKPNGTDISRPASSSGGIPELGEVYKATYLSLSKTGQYNDDVALMKAAHEESIKTILRNPKYASIAKQYDAGEINLGTAVVYMSTQSLFAGESASSSSAAKFAENEKVATDTIEQTKKNLDMDAVKKDVQKMINDILSNTAKQTGLLKNMLNQQA